MIRLGFLRMILWVSFRSVNDSFSDAHDLRAFVESVIVELKPARTESCCFFGLMIAMTESCCFLDG